jgi:eukaryotic-like serine/threonine-protein kinase
MTIERWRQVEDLFHSALDRAPNDRAAFLDATCVDDPALREQVEGLLESFDEAGDFIEKPLVDDSLSSRANTPSPSESVIGRKIGAYDILSLIGAGGMGEVYLARDARLDRQIALKLLPAQFTADPAQVQRFEREARAASALNHPNIITIYEIGQEDGMHFIATEFIEGCTLREIIVNGKMQLRESLAVAAQIAGALAAAHAAGIVHRDIKPENVMIRPDGLVKLLDFGLAKPVGKEGERGAGSGEWGVGIASFPHSQLPTPNSQLPLSQTTDPGMLMGTLAYLSPEQVRGESADHRADIFSLGVVLYEMIVWERPFKGDDAMETIDAILNREPALITNAAAASHGEFNAIFSHALTKDREARYQSAAEFGADLRRLAGKLESASPEAPGVTPRRRLWLGGAMITSIVLAVIVCLASILAALRAHNSDARDALSPWINARSIQLTAYPGEEFTPQLLPDGRSFVYVRRVGADWDVCLQRVGETGFKNLTSDCEDEDFHPALSPDGARIVFRSDCQGGGIFLMDSNGGGIRRLTDAGYNPVWSRDGKKVLYSTGKVFSPHIRRTAGNQLWTVNVATGEKNRIPTNDGLQPSWSPRGLRIAYWGVSPSKEPQRDIWTIPAGGGQPVAVTDDAAFDWNPVWSPDGRYLYFTSDRNGIMSLWRAPIDEESGKVLGQPEPVTGPSGESWHPSFSSDGRNMIYVQRIAGEEIQSVAFDPGREEVVGKPVSITQEIKQAGAPSLSPDDEWLTFHNFGAAQEDIFIIKRDGSGLRNLTNDACRDRFPQWSPDGKQIVFYSDCSGVFEVYTIAIASGARQRITDRPGAGCSFPVWAPDGARLAYHCRGLGAFIAETENLRAAQNPFVLPPMKEAGQWLVTRSWAPDGRKLAGMRAHTNDELPGVFLYSLNSRQYEQIAEIGNHPVWLNDSRRLLFTHQSRLYLTDSRSKTTREVLSLEPLMIGTAALSRDNRRLYLGVAKAEADIRLLTRK